MRALPCAAADADAEADDATDTMCGAGWIVARRLSTTTFEKTHDKANTVHTRD
jgi:hypothetical protein